MLSSVPICLLSTFKYPLRPLSSHLVSIWCLVPDFQFRLGPLKIPQGRLTAPSTFLVASSAPIIHQYLHIRCGYQYLPSTPVLPVLTTTTSFCPVYTVLPLRTPCLTLLPSKFPLASSQASSLPAQTPPGSIALGGQEGARKGGAQTVS